MGTYTGRSPDVPLKYIVIMLRAGVFGCSEVLPTQKNSKSYQGTETIDLAGISLSLGGLIFWPTPVVYSEGIALCIICSIYDLLINIVIDNVVSRCSNVEEFKT